MLARTKHSACEEVAASTTRIEGEIMSKSENLEFLKNRGNEYNRIEDSKERRVLKGAWTLEIHFTLKGYRRRAQILELKW